MNVRIGRAFWVIACAGSAIAAVLWVSPSMTSAEPPAVPPASSQPTGDQAAQEPAGKSDPEMRQRVREAVRRRLDNMRRETERLEQLAKALDDGKTLDEIRQQMPDSGRWTRQAAGPGGGGRMFGEALLRRLEDRRGGGEGFDLDTLGPTPLQGIGNEDPSQRHEPKGGSDHVLSDEDRAGVRDVLSAAAPGILKKIDELEKLDPQQAAKKFAEAWPRMKFLMDMRSRDRVQYDLTLGDVRSGREAMEAARIIVDMEKRGVQPGSSEYEKGQAALRTALGAQFEQRTRILQHQMDKMRERQAGMARDIATRSERQAEVVNRNVASLLDRERRRQDRSKDGEPSAPRHAPRGS